MSAYAEYKYGLLTEDQYYSECLREEAEAEQEKENEDDEYQFWLSSRLHLAGRNGTATPRTRSCHKGCDS